MQGAIRHPEVHHHRGPVGRPVDRAVTRGHRPRVDTHVRRTVVLHVRRLLTDPVRTRNRTGRVRILCQVPKAGGRAVVAVDYRELVPTGRRNGDAPVNHHSPNGIDPLILVLTFRPTPLHRLALADARGAVNRAGGIGVHDQGHRTGWIRHIEDGIGNRNRVIAGHADVNAVRSCGETSGALPRIFERRRTGPLHDRHANMGRLTLANWSGRHYLTLRRRGDKHGHGRERAILVAQVVQVPIEQPHVVRRAADAAGRLGLAGRYWQVAPILPPGDVPAPGQHRGGAVQSERDHDAGFGL